MRASATPPPPDVIPEEEQPEQPDPYCSAHMPDGIPGKCGPCGTARKNLNDWRERRDEKIRDLDAVIRKCGPCDDRGYIGLRAGPFINCPHDAQEIARLERYHHEKQESEV